MAGWLSFVLAAFASMIAMTESRAIPAEPISVMLDAYDNPVMFIREKRTAVHPYPHRAMMFTGYYRPIRRSSNGGQATGVFAQGNTVSGETFFGDVPRLKNGPEPIDEPEISSAEAQAAPVPEKGQELPSKEHRYQNEIHYQHKEQQHHEHHREEEEQHHHSLTPQENYEPEQTPLTTEVAHPAEEPASTEVSRPKVHRNKKTHKTPVIADDDDDDDDDEDEADEEDEEPIVPFVPFKGNKRRQRYPNLNNFFPMVFSFPRVAARAGSSGSPPGAITAIANSYSTGKSGVASSVATAYGGSSTGKKRRPQPYEE